MGSDGAEPVAQLGVARAVRAAAVGELRAELADRAEALGEDVVVVDRLEVDLAREDEVVVEAKLGFLLAMFRDRIDEELVRILDKEFPELKRD